MNHTREQFRAVSRARLKSVNLLMEKEDWDVAGYLMGYVLECALKAAVCKVLRLSEYPSSNKDEKDYFWTHRFDRLLTVSGLQDLFGTNRLGYFVWSQFTQEYDGDWPGKYRYMNGQFDEKKVRQLYLFLNDTSSGNEGIVPLIKKYKRW